MPKFSHLHVHTQYSLLDGAASIQSLYKKAIANDMPAVAITDHGNMYGVFQFVNEAYKHTNEDGSLKVKPIVGCEFYITENRHRKQFSKEEKDPRCHQVLLAKNEKGYKNLIKICSLGFTEGLYSKYPRIDKELILQYHEGLIATTCCLGAMVPQAILKKGEAAAEKEFLWWYDIFGEDYYVELQRHGMAEQEKVNEVLIRFARKYNVKIIASNDSHYVEQEDFNAHDILLCINTGEKVATPALREFSDDDVQTKNKRFAFPNDQFFFKTKEQMQTVFSDLEEALDNTNEIVDKVDLLNLKKDIMLPFFQVPPGFKTQDDYLAHITWEGAKMRYSEMTPEIEDRLKFELFTVKTMGFAGYFLIVSDFIKAGRDMGVFVGPGRGSAAGSVVAYCIGITNIDPIKYQLLFERFLNPDRKSMPDIDTDFDDEGRQKVIDYVVQKYTKKQVAQIITYGTMAAKMSIKDVARVMDLPLADANVLAKLVPDRPGISLKRVLTAPLTGDKSLSDKEGLGNDDLENVKRLREFYNNTDTPQGKVLREAEKLEGSVRNTGIHAAGIIIAPEDLTNIIPVCIAKDSDLLVTQIEGSVIEEAGVIKMDFLGLKTLNILKTSLELIEQNHGIAIDIDTIPLDDLKTYELYQHGDTNGTFQFESVGMQKYLRELKPDKFADLIAMNALYRPGPLAYIPNFIDRKHGREAITYDLPEMQEYLEDTYGITVYQEQVMLLSQKLAGFTKGDADTLRKAMGKKQKSVLDKMKAKFMEGTAKNNFAPETCEKIWTDWEAFAQYAFNKSHSTCYAFVAFQTAYLKAHYPSEYMAAVLNHAGSIEKITFFMEECKRMGQKVLGSDVNESQSGCAVNPVGEIRFGLAGLKGVGEAAVENILDERKKNGPFKSVFDLIKRVNQRSVNKKSLESLIYSGAFDCFKEMHRAQYFFAPPGDVVTGLERIIRFGNMVQTATTQSSNSLFGDLLMPEIATPKIPPCEPWNLTELLEHEKEVTGMYMSGHPLDHHKFELRHYDIMPLGEFNEYKDTIAIQSNPGRHIKIAGLVVGAQHRIAKNGNKYGSFTIEDYTGNTEFPLFRDDYVKMGDYFKPGNSVCVVGNFGLGFDRSEYRFRVLNVYLIESLKQLLTKQLHVVMHPKDVNDELIDFIQQNLKKNPGKACLRLSMREEKEALRISLFTRDKGFTMNDELADYLLGHPDWEIQVTA
jgi:DNA polymerase III subunit alpha